VRENFTRGSVWGVPGDRYSYHDDFFQVVVDLSIASPFRVSPVQLHIYLLITGET